MKRSTSRGKATRRKTMKRDSSVDRPEYQPQFLRARHYFVLVVMLSVLAGLVTRALYLQVVEQDFLASQGVQRQIRTIETPAYRGSILDRFGTPLAISTPVDSVWVNPAEILKNIENLKQVTDKLELDYRDTVAMLKQRANREFVYLKRQLEPDFARSVASGIGGVYLQREYNRYYPAGEVVSHLVGFTNIDDQGQEGLELAYQDWLSAQPGQRRVIRNRHGEVIEELAQVSRAVSGKDIYSSIDMPSHIDLSPERSSITRPRRVLPCYSTLVAVKFWRWSISHPITRIGVTVWTPHSNVIVP